MKNKKGFTLIELLAVVVVLGLIMIIATSAVGKVIENSKIKARYIAAKEITEIAAAYLSTEGGMCVSVEELLDKHYLEGDITNPGDKDAKNITSSDQVSNQKICIDDSATLQSDYNVEEDSNGNPIKYKFDGYVYKFN